MPRCSIRAQCLLLQRFVCCTEAITEAVTEGKEPIETDERKPEPTKTEPLAVAKEPSPTENGSSQPQCGEMGMKEQAECASSAVKEESPSSSPPPGK